MTRLSGNVAIVTGASRGTGEAIARRLVEDGSSVILVDILDELGEAVAKDLGERARYVRCDITSEVDWISAINVARSTFGPLTTLVNNAAILHIAPIEHTSVEDYLRVSRVNELGTFLGIRSAIAPLREAGGGSIINIASILLDNLFFYLLLNLLRTIKIPTVHTSPFYANKSCLINQRRSMQH